MRRFVFIGDPLDVYADCFEIGRIYDGHLKVGKWKSVQELAKDNPKDWEEVFQKMMTYDKFFKEAEKLNPMTKPVHKDTDLGYFAGLAMQAMIAVYTPNCSKKAILLAKELIKQLDKELPNNLPPNHNE